MLVLVLLRNVHSTAVQICWQASHEHRTSAVHRLSHALHARTSARGMDATSSVRTVTTDKILDGPPCPSPLLHDGPTCVGRELLRGQPVERKELLRQGRARRSETAQKFALAVLFCRNCSRIQTHRVIMYLTSQAREHGGSLA